MNAALESIYIKAAGSSEGAKKGWEHRQRWQASAALKELRKSGFRGRVSIEHDPRNGVYFLRKQEGELAARKPAREITPYDKEIRRMKKFGTTDLHGALTDAIYDDQQARREYEGDFENPEEADWESAAADLASNYLKMHRLPHQIKSSERIVVEVVKASSLLEFVYEKAQRQLT
jgi:hypothetical protein